jgi:hypothetical protein
MSVYISDPFNSLALGPGTPPNWSAGFGINVDYAGSSGRGGVGGLYPGDNWYSAEGVTSPSLTRQLGYPSGPVSASIWFGYRHESIPNGLPIIVVNAVNSTFTNETTIFTLFIEDDFSISGYTGNNTTSYPPPFGNTGSGNLYFPWNTWYFCQLNLATGFITVGGNQYVTVTIELAIEGSIVLMAGPINTFILVSSLGKNAVDQIAWEGNPYIDISQVTLEDQVPIDTYPNPGTPNIRVSQMPIEVMTLPSNANVRLTQMPIEYMILPTTANVRASQMVIELATPFPSSTGTGPFPEYYKRRTAPGNS